jgi:tetratricopeptide (TPR) repeat protein
MRRLFVVISRPARLELFTDHCLCVCRVAAVLCGVLSLGLRPSAALGPFTPPTTPAFIAQTPVGKSVTRVFDGLGRHGRKITTTGPEAQVYFNQGLNFLYAFNHDEAIRSFQEAARLDPRCAMAYWGIAIANGPHINNTAVPPERAKTAWDALVQARALAKSCGDADRALIEALVRRYADPPPEDRTALDQDYAAAMRKVWKQFSHDADVGALFAESLMDLRPWNLWTAEGQPQPETPEILTTLEAVMAQQPNHPLALHLYIHAIEASPTPEKGDVPADRLRDLVPGLGHMVHMPSHIDLRRGRWQQAVETNLRAIEADRKYQQIVPQQGFYRIYMAHNHHMLAFAAMMQGESQRSLEAIRTLLAGIPRDWLEQKENAAFADGLYALPVEVLMRFGRWEELLQEPGPPESLPVARALRHFACGVALAALGRLPEARAAQQSFREAVAKTPEDAFVGNNPAANLFAIAESMLEGEMLIKEAKMKEGLAALRVAVTKEDQLKYDEPPDWIQPVRHALGAALLRAGEAAEAESVYRADLRRWPDNGWSLYGLARSLEVQGKSREASEMRERFEKAWQRADVKLTASCFCQDESAATRADRPPRRAR